MEPFEKKKPIIGVVHLLPLPSSPEYKGMDRVLKRAKRDAEKLVDGGVDGLLIENYGDVPYLKTVREETVEGMKEVCDVIKKNQDLPMGVNVLRNDWRGALEVAISCSLAFIRINVYTGVVFTDQGIIEGQAGKIQRYISKNDMDIDIFADVHVKHGKTLFPEEISEAARDAVERGQADAIIVSGSRTGEAVDREELEKVKSVVNTPVLIGSGLKKEGKEMLKLADGAIVGTAFKEKGETTAPVEEERVKELVDEFRDS